MSWLRFGRPSPDEAIDEAGERERVRERLRDQERRVLALERAVEVIQRSLTTEYPDARPS